MDTERRQSMRVAVRLPCQWHAFEELPRRGDLIGCFELPQVTLEALELGRTVAHELKEVADPSLRHVLGLLNRRLDLITTSLQQSRALPPVCDLELSADGLAVPTATPLAVGSWVGVHLVFDDGADFVALGRVCHSTPRGDGFCTGLCVSDAEDAKVLARQIMRISRN